MTKTNLDEIIDYPSKIISKLIFSQKIIGLLVDNPNIDIQEEQVDLSNKQIFDFAYIDGTQEQVKTYICIDTDVVSVPTPTTKNMEILIYVISHRDNMKLDSEIFKGIRGNRRDNIIREIDLLMNGSSDFGIGKVELKQVKNTPVPIKYIGKVMVYKVIDFNRDRRLVQ